MSDDVVVEKRKMTKQGNSWYAPIPMWMVKLRRLRNAKIEVILEGDHIVIRKANTNETS